MNRRVITAMLIIAMFTTTILTMNTSASHYWGGTTDWDVGLKNNTATHTDFNITTPGALRLRPGVNYSINFDTSSIPSVPDDWVLNAAGDFIGESEEQALTGNRSLKIKGIAGKNVTAGVGIFHIYIWVFMNETDENNYIQFYNDTNHEDLHRITSFQFRLTGKMRYLGAAWSADTIDYALGWNLLKVRFSRNGNSFAAWLNGVQFAAVGTLCHCGPWDYLEALSVESETSDIFIDDIVIGYNHTAGDWVSEDRDFPINHRIDNLSIRYNASVNNSIEQIIVRSNGSAAWYNATIDSGDNITINETMLTGGSFAALDGAAYNVTLVLVGEDSSEIEITNLTVNFEEIPAPPPAPSEETLKQAVSTALFLCFVVILWCWLIGKFLEGCDD